MQRKRFALTVAFLFFAIHPIIHFRPLYPFYEAALIAFHFPIERWYDIPHPIKLQLCSDEVSLQENPAGDGPRPAWFSFAAICLVAYLTVIAKGGGLSLAILKVLPLVGGLGVIVFVLGATGVSIDLWSQNRFRLSILGLLLLTALIAYTLALLASGP